MAQRCVLPSKLTVVAIKDCMIGIVFADEREAKTFYKKVTSTKGEKGMRTHCVEMCRVTNNSFSQSSFIIHKEESGQERQD